MLARLTSILDKIILVFGAIFCAQWAVALVAFPIYKERLSGYLPIAMGVVVGLVFCSSRVRHAISQKITGVSPGVFVIGVAVLAMSVRLLAVLVFPIEPVNDHLFFHRYAINMLDGKGYGGLAWPSLP